MTKEYIGVDVEVRATDFDKANQGWAGIVKEVHPKRLTMRLMPGIDSEKLRDQKHVKGDIIMLFKDRNGSLKPSSFHLERIHDDVDIIGGDKPPGRPGAKKGEAKGGEA